MKCVALFAFIVAVGASATPVEKVVKLLESLKGNLKSDEYNEANACDRFRCWAANTLDEKAEAIKQAQLTLEKGRNEVMGLKSLVNMLSAEITELKNDIADNKAAQEEATNIRQKENAAYNAATGDLTEALAALEKAVTVLLRGTNMAKGSTAAKKKESLLQDQQSEAAMARTVAAEVVAKMPVNAAARLSNANLEMLQQVASTGYAPQSATVQGMLSDMYTTFSKDLMTGTETEATANRVFEELIALKQRELAQAEKTKAKKEEERAEAEATLAKETTIYDDTQAQMNADITFFDNVNKAGSDKHNECVSRKTLRDEELEGVEKALQLLTSDEARDALLKAHENVRDDELRMPSFLQLTSSAAAIARDKAYQMLKAAATRSKNVGLAQVAVAVATAEVGHFQAVIKEITKMIGTLDKEDDMDKEKRDECKAMYTDIESKSTDLAWKIKVNDATIDKHTKMREADDKEKQKTIDERTALKEKMQKAEEQRNSDKVAHENGVADDKAAIALLEQALDFLESYWKNRAKEGAALLQQEPVFDVSKKRAPEAKTAAADSRSGESNAIISLLKVITDDLRIEIQASKAAEANAVANFDAMWKAGTQAVNDMSSKITALGESMSAHTRAINQQDILKQGNNMELTGQENLKADIKPDCDFIINNFESRASKREVEKEALMNAKAFLAGLGNPELENPKLVQVRAHAVALRGAK